MIVHYPPAPADYDPTNTTLPSIFLAGTIEMGLSVDWQAKFITTYSARRGHIFNPRRNDWDSSWRQSIDNPEFKAQVDWEMAHIDDADIVVMYLDPDSMSPISLLELGYLAGTAPEKVIVCCPKGFWRKGNVEVICYRHGIELVTTMATLHEKIAFFFDRWESVGE